MTQAQRDIKRAEGLLSHIIDKHNKTRPRHLTRPGFLLLMAIRGDRVG
jgi:ribosomal protein L35